MEILDRHDRLPASRVAVVQYLILFGFLGLVYGLWQLQILQQGKYASLAEHNRIRTDPIPAPRGKIYDRQGRLIVDNYPSFTAFLMRDANPQWQADLPGIAAGLYMPVADLQARVAHFHAAPPYQPIPIKDDITAQDVAYIEAHRDQFPELETLMVSRRLYPKNGFAAHLIGYVGEPTEKQIASGALQPGTLVGKSGVEQYYNDLLMGHDGERRVMVDARGRVVATLSDTEPQPGHDLHLTLDNDIQIAAEQAIGDRPGAVVALDPRNGEILAMVSRPSFDPNLFTQGLSVKQWQQWTNDPDRPLLNKAIQAQLAPGSVFKLVVSAAGLQENVAQNLEVNCQGVFHFHGTDYKCWIAARNEVHGELNLHQAIVQSCDIYFYTLGDKLGIGTIDRYAQAMGLGQATGVDLPGEAKGLLPSPQWKEARFHQAWLGGETINTSIGQGALTATPLQLARLVGGIADGGDFARPHVALGADVSGAALHVALSDDTVARITDAMRDVVKPGGTAASAHLQDVDFGGKTGTAQTISNVALKTVTGSHRQFIDNAWFVGVYPVRNPEIAVCVLFQRGAEGSYAAQIAAQVVQAYYNKHAGEHTAALAAATIGGGPPMTLRLRDFDWLLLAAVLVITTAGVLEIHSATRGTIFHLVYVKQIYFLIAGMALLLVFSQIDYKLLLEASPWLYGVSVLALLAVLTVGQAIFHSKRWIPVAGSHLQVSEFVKLVIIVVVARYCGQARLDLSWKDVGRVGVLVGIPAVLVLKEPDLGTALTYLPIAAVGLFLGGLKWRQFGLLVLGSLLVMPLAWRGLHGYQRGRLEIFRQPESDRLGRGYQLLQSKIAVGAGGLWGQGMAQGSQTAGGFLPVPHTDFIFAAFAEEFGFAGSLLLLGLYLFVLMRLIQNAQLAPDRNAGMIVMGVVAVLAFHLLVNVGMDVGLMPVTGIPLPLMSAGGSSLLFMFAALGMVMNIRMARFVN